MSILFADKKLPVLLLSRDYGKAAEKVATAERLIPQKIGGDIVFYTDL